MKGTITRRGKNSWRLKFDVGRDPATGKRETRYVTFRGTKRQAESELTTQLATLNSGTFVEQSKLTVADYLRAWVERAGKQAISGRTAERYSALIEKQIIPFLGSRPLQKLRPTDIAAWHAALLERGAVKGGPLSARTTGHCHRVLRKALADAVRQELLSRNVAAVISAPKVDDEEMSALNAEEVLSVLGALETTPIYPHVVLLVSTGMRRGELMGLQWSDVDFETAKLRIERAIEKTKAHGLRTKSPKTRHGRRHIALPEIAIVALRDHRRKQLEIRVALGVGKLPDDFFVFGTIEGAPHDPDYLTRAWRRYVAAGRIPDVPLHALRHSHASALIAGKHDPVTVSRRLGHGNPAITMRVYAHLFDRGDDEAARTIDTLFGNRSK